MADDQNTNQNQPVQGTQTALEGQEGVEANPVAQTGQVAQPVSTNQGHGDVKPQGGADVFSGNFHFCTPCDCRFNYVTFKPPASQGDDPALYSGPRLKVLSWRAHSARAAMRLCLFRPKPLAGKMPPSFSQLLQHGFPNYIRYIGHDKKNFKFFLRELLIAGIIPRAAGLAVCGSNKK